MTEKMSTSRTFARIVAWGWLFGFVAFGCAAAWGQDSRMAGVAFVLLIGCLLSSMAAVW